MRPAAANQNTPQTGEVTEQFVTLRLNGQLIGLPIGQVRDVFQIHNLTPVPCAPASVSGLCNLRGKIVVVFSLAGMMGVSDAPPPVSTSRSRNVRMAVGVDWQGETFGIQIDDIGDVMTLPVTRSAALPSHLSGEWVRHARRIHKLDHEMMIELDLRSLIETPANNVA